MVVWFERVEDFGLGLGYGMVWYGRGGRNRGREGIAISKRTPRLLEDERDE